MIQRYLKAVSMALLISADINSIGWSHLGYWIPNGGYRERYGLHLVLYLDLNCQFHNMVLVGRYGLVSYMQQV